MSRISSNITGNVSRDTGQSQEAIVIDGLRSNDPTRFRNSIETFCQLMTTTEPTRGFPFVEAGQVLLGRLATEGERWPGERAATWRALSMTPAPSGIQGLVGAAVAELASPQILFDAERARGVLGAIGLIDTVRRRAEPEMVFLPFNAASQTNLLQILTDPAFDRVFSGRANQREEAMSSILPRALEMATPRSNPFLFREPNSPSSNLLRAEAAFLTSAALRSLTSENDNRSIGTLLRHSAPVLSDPNFAVLPGVSTRGSVGLSNSYALAVALPEVHPKRFIVSGALRGEVASEGREPAFNIDLGSRAYALLAIGNHSDRLNLTANETQELLSCANHSNPLIRACAAWAHGRVTGNRTPASEAALDQALAANRPFADTLLALTRGRGSELGFLLHGDTSLDSVSAPVVPRTTGRVAEDLAIQENQVAMAAIRAAAGNNPDSDQMVARVSPEVLRRTILGAVEGAVSAFEGSELNRRSFLESGGVRDTEAVLRFLRDRNNVQLFGAGVEELASNVLRLGGRREINPGVFRDVVRALGISAIETALPESGYLRTPGGNSEAVIDAIGSIREQGVFSREQVSVVIDIFQTTQDIGVRRACYRLLAREDVRGFAEVAAIRETAAKDAQMGLVRSTWLRLGHVVSSVLDGDLRRASFSLPFEFSSNPSSTVRHCRRAAQDFLGSLRASS